MADEKEADSKTEDATSKRIEDARKQGDVAKSPEVTQLAGLAGAFGVIIAGGGWLARDMADKLTPFLAHPDAFRMAGPGGVAVGRYALEAALPAMVAVMGATMLSGVAGNVLQTGLMFTPSKLAPDLSKLSLIKGFQRLFGIDGFVQFLRAALKVLLTGVVAWAVLSPHAHELAGLANLDIAAILPFGVRMATDLAIGVLILLAALAGADFIWQRRRHAAKLRMTKEEVKEDYKQAEGDPHVKARQRQIRNDRARRRMIQAGPTATVVVMNPTHFAVALRYEAGQTAAPECVAKGVDAVAFKIREVAEAAGVPIIEDAPLARALYATVEVDEVIPQEHFQAVAKIIGFIMSAAKAPKRAGQM